MFNYDTVSEAVNDLAKRGYTYNFVLNKDSIFCNSQNLALKPEEFHIDEIYRFEGETDPADEAIVYAISSEKPAIKGVLVNAFGMYADSTTSALIVKLSAR